jgi:hypothetical protein
MASATTVNPILDVRARIEKTLHLRSARRGTRLAWVEERVKATGAVLWRELRKRPSLGVLVVGGAGIALASFVGVGELTVGVFAAYGAYLVLREGMPPVDAVVEVFQKAR